MLTIDGIARLNDAAFAPKPRADASNESVATPSFETFVAQSVGGAYDTMRGAEAAARQGLLGKASALDVVSTVMSAERTLQTMLAIREKATSALQEISRMSI